MSMRNTYGSGKFGLSIEIFPPKSADGDGALWENLDRLMRYKPAFVSCTYGAGGSTRNRTIDLCREIMRRYQTAATAHFTCVGSTVDELKEWLGQASAAGIANIMALRGDPPAGQTDFRQVEGGLRYANELVALIRSGGYPFGIGVAGYPEKHPQAPSLAADIENLKRKVDSGGDAVFTQLFYMNSSFFSFRDRCVAAGIHAPIVPGIMPVTNFAQIKRIAGLCGAVLPTEFARKLEAVQEDKEAQLEVGVEFAIQQCRELIDAGVPGIHFYALNRSQACEMILNALNYEPAAT
jgi:methylenetetrahydrofolate reductase (NADPH)